MNVCLDLVIPYAQVPARVCVFFAPGLFRIRPFERLRDTDWRFCVARGGRARLQCSGSVAT